MWVVWSRCMLWSCFILFSASIHWLDVVGHVTSHCYCSLNEQKLWSFGHKHTHTHTCCCSSCDFCACLCVKVWLWTTLNQLHLCVGAQGLLALLVLKVQSMFKLYLPSRCYPAPLCVHWSSKQQHEVQTKVSSAVIIVLLQTFVVSFSLSLKLLLVWTPFTL